MIATNELKILTSHGTISLLHFPSAKQMPKIKVLCIHGYCCDARIFRYIGFEMSKRGYDVYAIDLLGHGKSDGPRGDPDFDRTIEAIKEVIDKIRDQSSFFLLGHSLGCTYVLWYALTYRHDIDGIILMSPYVRVKGIRCSGGEAVPTLPRFVKLFLLRLLVPSRRISAIKVVQDSIVRTSETQQMINDPAINYYYSYKYIIDVIGIRNMKLRKFADIHIPVLLLHGKRDRNVFPQVSEEFFKRLRSTNKSISIFDCDHWFYHSIFYNQKDEKYNEHDRQQVVSTIMEWLNRVGNEGKRFFS